MATGTLSVPLVEIATASAILSIRSIVQRFPNQRCCLVPYDWSRRYGKYLGSYVSFIRSKCPDVFLVEEEVDSGLFFVRLSDQFQHRGYLTYQRVVDSVDKNALDNDMFADEDAYTSQICSIIDRNTRMRIAGGIGAYKQAEDTIKDVMARTTEGCRVDQVRKVFSDSGIPPIPLEWFDNHVLVLKPNFVYLRRTPAAITSSCSTEEGFKILALLEKSVENFATVDSVAHALGLSREIAAEKLRLFPSVLYKPDTIMTCAFFEKLVVGYKSPDTLRREAMDEELLSMSPFIHLLKSIEAVLDNLPDHKLGTEYVLAWCAALDVNPRNLWQCLQHKIVWGSHHSERQVFFRKVSSSKESDDDSKIPRDVAQTIRAGIRKLGSTCSVDKLSSILHWGKASDNRRKYGLLPSVLLQLKDVFYDPLAMYSRSFLEDIIVFTAEADEIDAGELTKRIDIEFVSLAHISATLRYFLSQGGCNSYPLNDARGACLQYGIPDSNLSRLTHIFIPGNSIYLRKNFEEFHTNQPSPKAALLHALRSSSRRALDYDDFFRVLTESKRFTSAEINQLKSEVVAHCNNLIHASSEHQVAQFCYYNPSVVVLDSEVSKALAIPEQSPRKCIVSNFVTQGKTQEVETEISEDEPADIGDSTNVLPPWCKVGVIVKLSDSGEDLILTRVSPTSLYIRPLNSGDGADEKCVQLESLNPRSLRVSDNVLITAGVFSGRSGHLVGVTPSEGSVQFSKFEFRSFPISVLAPFAGRI